MKTSCRWVIATALLGAACGSTVDHEPTSSTAQAVIAGYEHRLEVSRFVLGSIEQTTVDQYFTKTVGLYGVFAVNNTNRSASGLPSAGAPIGTQIAGSDPTLGELGRSYFVANGLPENQIGSVSIHGGSEGATAVLNRAFEGSFIADSTRSPDSTPTGRRRSRVSIGPSCQVR
jgi:hypothetical protein